MAWISVTKACWSTRDTSGNLGGDWCGVVINLPLSMTIPLVLRNCVFNDVCKWHDTEYNKLNWADKNTNSVALDAELLRRFLVIAGDSKKLKAQAYSMYFAARTWGRMRWGASRLGIIW
jgi:hypothetical protein